MMIEGNELTLTGRRRPAPSGEVLHREVGTNDYRRTFLLDPVIDTAKIPGADRPRSAHRPLAEGRAGQTPSYCGFRLTAERLTVPCWPGAFWLTGQSCFVQGVARYGGNSRPGGSSLS